MATTQKGLEGLWLKSLLFVLFGYALLDKGFAYLFFGEMVLIFGAAVFLRSRRIMIIFNDPVLLLWGAFAFWGMCRTLPYLETYRFDAIRDAVTWGYGFFAVLIVAFVNRSSQISRGLNAYRKFLRWFLPAIPFLMLISFMAGGSLPNVPFSKVSILTLKAGDAAVICAGAFVFLMAFPNPIRGAERGEISIYRSIQLVGVLLTSIVVLITTRGGFLSIVLSVALFAVLRARKILWKIAAVSIVGIVLAAAVFLILPESFQIGDRVVNTDKVLATIASIGGGSDKGTGHEGTAEWRLDWWTTIVHETFFGPYFWKGRGFGVNLAVADGPVGRSDEEVALRSPHSGTMTVLARMGVPGFLIWITLNVTFAIRMFKAQRRAAKRGSQFWSGLNLWILACWLAALTNLSFDVYLEGPQGGIWFWCVIGLGVAALRIQKNEARQLAASWRMSAQESLESAQLAFDT